MCLGCPGSLLFIFYYKGLEGLVKEQNYQVTQLTAGHIRTRFHRITVELTAISKWLYSVLNSEIQVSFFGKLGSVHSSNSGHFSNVFLLSNLSEPAACLFCVHKIF